MNLTEEKKEKVIEGLKKEKPELSEKDIKAKMNNIPKLNDEELEKVVGGGFERPDLDPNKEICGWTYTDLYELLCWCYETWTGPTTIEKQTARNITLGVANDMIPTSLWQKYKDCDYPEFIKEPMWRIWCSNSYGM